MLTEDLTDAIAAQKNRYGWKGRHKRINLRLRKGVAGAAVASGVAVAMAFPLAAHSQEPSVSPTFVDPPAAEAEGDHDGDAADPETTCPAHVCDDPVPPAIEPAQPTPTDPTPPVRVKRDVLRPHVVKTIRSRHRADEAPRKLRSVPSRVVPVEAPISAPPVPTPAPAEAPPVVEPPPTDTTPCPEPGPSENAPEGTDEFTPDDTTAETPTAPTDTITDPEDTDQVEALDEPARGPVDVRPEDGNTGGP